MLVHHDLQTAIAICRDTHQSLLLRIQNTIVGQRLGNISVQRMLQWRDHGQGVLIVDLAHRRRSVLDVHERAV